MCMPLICYRAEQHQFMRTREEPSPARIGTSAIMETFLTPRQVGCYVPEVELHEDTKTLNIMFDLLFGAGI
jgi:hypothetical protein